MQNIGEMDYLLIIEALKNDVREREDGDSQVPVWLYIMRYKM